MPDQPSKHLIQYEYPGTTNGRPVGTVYVTGPLITPRSGIFSHTYLVSEAATWLTREAAERELARRYWPNAKVVPLAEASDLLGRERQEAEA